MSTINRILHKVLHSITLVTLLIFVSACAQAPQEEPSVKFKTLADFSGSSVGALTGTPYEGMMPDEMKDLNWMYYEDLACMLPGLRDGDINAIVTDSPVAELVSAQHSDEFAQFPEMTSTCDFSMILKKNSRLTKKVSRIIREFKEDGTLDSLIQKWLSGDPDKMTIDWSKYDSGKRKRKTLKLAYNASFIPMVYTGADGKPAGVEPELVLMIAQRLNMNVEFIGVKLSSLLIYVQQGKADLGAGCLVMTPERQKNADFCESYYSGGVSLICRKDDIELPDVDSRNAIIAVVKGTEADSVARATYPNAQYIYVPDAAAGFQKVHRKKAKAFATSRDIYEKFLETGRKRMQLYEDGPQGETVMVIIRENTQEKQHISFSKKIKDSFYKTFVRENRWEMILHGLWITLWITLGAALIGSIVGFVLCLGLQSKNKFLTVPIQFFMNLMIGIPSLVILMITFFIIFGKADIHPIYVGMIAFGGIFAIAIADILNNEINSIDRGQWEAAIALGFSKYGAFFYIILPQALRRALPLYKANTVALMQMTSIAGYISIEELTQVGDIIRSRTYEAFFPLITVALIYFALSSLLTYGISKIEISIDPRRKTKKLPKGVSYTLSDETDLKFEKYKDLGEDILINIEHLKVAFKKFTPLKDVNVNIKRGEIVSLIGPSGSGKSTLMRCINRLESQTEGHVSLFGQDTSDHHTDLRSLRRRAGMVFQSFNLFNDRTVIENIVLSPIVLNKENKKDVYQNALRLLQMVGMSEKAMNFPDELSGGEKQRVAIARTLAMNPEIILFDEPTSSLDPNMASEVFAVIRSLAREGLTMMIVTHDMKFAKDISTRTLYMDQGIIYEDGTPEQIFEHPQKENTRKFIQRLKTLQIDITSPRFDFIKTNIRIMKYGLKNGLNDRSILRMQNIFEELCVLMVLPTLKKEVNISTIWEYSEEKGQVSMKVRYNGPAFNPLDDGDELSVMMIHGSCTEINYKVLSGDGAFSNEISAILKK